MLSHAAAQQPFGFHLADGTLYTYLQGNEYEDIAAAWDWNLIPGTTVDYGNTPLNCNNAEFSGLNAFVGGASTGKTGVAAMRYTNPLTKALSWQKAWFFLDDDTQHVMIANLTSQSNATVYSVLDQRRHNGPVRVNGATTTKLDQTFHNPVSSLWHGGVGYTFDQKSAIGLNVSVGDRSGAWSAIGTSPQPPITVDLFAASILHENVTTPVSYTIFPGTDFGTFQSKSNKRHIRTLQNDAHMSAVFDEDHNKVAVVFWDSTGGSLHFLASLWHPVALQADGNAAVILDLKSGNITVADPSQTLSTVNITAKVGLREPTKRLTIRLPQGGSAGSSVSQKL